MSGLILGILLARTFSGLVAQVAGWRTLYVIAAVLMLAQTVLLYVKLPRFRQSAGSGVPQAARLGLRHRARRAGAAPPLALRRLLVRHVQHPVDDAWPSCWPVRRTGTASGVIGLFGLVGAAGALTASLVGRFTDRGWVYWLTGGGCWLLLLGFVFLWLGRRLAAALLVGILLLDVGSQGVHISNQSEIYRLRPEARNRINAFYMTSCFVGAAVGSAAAAFAYDRWGWAGHVRARPRSSALAAVARWATDRQRPLAEREPVPEAPPPA